MERTHSENLEGNARTILGHAEGRTVQNGPDPTVLLGKGHGEDRETAT